MDNTPTKPSEEDIQKVLKMLEETQPDKATREYAIQTIERMKSMANVLLDRIEDDVQSGKVTVNDKGEVVKDGTVISE